MDYGPKKGLVPWATSRDASDDSAVCGWSKERGEE
jgi:hypothetical protein